MAKGTKNAAMNPKMIVAILLLVAFSAGFIVARIKYKPQIVELSNMAQEKAKEATEVKMSANKVMMKNGKLWLVKDGTADILDADVIFSNGNRVKMDGTIVKDDGTETEMEEGQSIDMNGDMMMEEDTEN